MKDLLKKSIIFLLGGKNFVIFKCLKSIYLSIQVYKKIFPLIKSRKFMFFKKIIYSVFFINFNLVKPEEKKSFNNKYSFKFNDLFSNKFNVWKKYLIHIPNFYIFRDRYF